MTNRETYPGSSIASTALPATSLRVLFQDSSLAIREFRHSSTSSWSGGATNDRITSTKRRRAPLAVKEWTESGKRRIRVYTLDAQNNVHEVGCDGEGSWVDCYHGPRAAPFSDIATTMYDANHRRIRVYYQLPDRQIQELCNDAGWASGAIMRPLPAGAPSQQPIEGTGIASVGWGNSAADIRNYVQDDSGYICEYRYCKGGTLPFRVFGFPLSPIDSYPTPRTRSHMTRTLRTRIGTHVITDQTSRTDVSYLFCFGL